MVLATMQEQSVMVPVSALRLLSNSVHAIREALDKLIVMAPVLSAAEAALQRYSTN